MAESRWLTPSIKIPVHNIKSLTLRLLTSFLITDASVDDGKFDTQLMKTPEIRRGLYQQGTLAGYKVRQYLLEKFKRLCAYCKKEGRKPDN